MTNQIIVSVFAYTKTTYGRNRKRSAIVNGERVRPDTSFENKEQDLDARSKAVDKRAKAMGMTINNKDKNVAKYYFVTHSTRGDHDILEKLTELGYTGDVMIMDRGSVTTKTI